MQASGDVSDDQVWRILRKYDICLQRRRSWRLSYRRHGTTTLFAALDIATGQVKAGHYTRRRRREFLDYMNGIVSNHPGREIHVILDNLNTHKSKFGSVSSSRRLSQVLVLLRQS